MALTKIKRNAGSKELEFYVVREDGVVTYGIPVVSLFAVDVKILSEVDAKGEGEDLQEKLLGYTLSNNLNGWSVYRGLVVDVDAYADLIARRGGGSGGEVDPAVIASIQDAIQGISGQVTALQSDIQGLDGRVGEVQSDIQGLDGRVTALENTGD